MILIVDITRVRSADVAYHDSQKFLCKYGVKGNEYVGNDDEWYLTEYYLKPEDLIMLELSHPDYDEYLYHTSTELAVIEGEIKAGETWTQVPPGTLSDLELAYREKLCYNA